MEKHEYKERVDQHKLSVRIGMKRISNDIELRGITHDDDKLEPDMLNQFYEVSKEFDGVKFGTPEYQEVLNKLKPSIDKHYKNNSHHPQHYENGINGMNLLDLIEMIVDWNSAANAYSHGTSDLKKSIDINKERFLIDEQLYQVILNTAKYLGYIKEQI